MIHALPFVFLFVGLLATYSTQNARNAFICLGLGYVAGLALGIVTPVGLVLATVLTGFAYLYYLKPFKKIPQLLVLISLLAILAVLGLRLVSGFRNFQIIPPLQISPNAIRYSIWWNFEKPTIAIVLGAFVLLRDGPSKKVFSVKKVVGLGALGIVVTLGAAWGINYADWNPKFTPLFWTWFFANLFVTCAGEEAIFRGFIQRELENVFPNPKHRRAFPPVIATLLFGLAHLPGGWDYVFLSTIAGVFYGLVYQMTGRVRYSILLHVFLNTGHFLFFTYPKLQ